MNIFALQEAVIKQLSDKLQGVKCEHFPESGAYKLNNPNGAVLVLCSGGNFDLPDARNSQKVRHNVALTVVAKNLYNNHGVLDLVSKVKDVLSGWVPRAEGVVAERSYFSRYAFSLKQKDGAWHYGLDLVVTTMEMI